MKRVRKAGEPKVMLICSLSGAEEHVDEAMITASAAWESVI
ncbi:hypothetical protein P4H46_06825 [Paenibacillus glucanolyticus]